MAKRRGNNEGTITQLPSDSWRVQLRLQGTRLSHTSKTQKEAQSWLRKTQTQIDNGLKSSSIKTRVDDFMSSWLINIKESKCYTTWTQYDRTYRQYIQPDFGKIQIAELTPEHIQRLYSNLLHRSVGVYVVRKIHTILSSALSQAVKLGIINRNPVSVVIQPRLPSKEMKILNESQVCQMLVANRGHRWEALYHLDIKTGMRQMEVLGLKWTDVDWKRGTIRVERQLLRLKGEKPQFSEPKTQYGKRTIPLGASVLDNLSHHYELQRVDKETAGEDWEENDLIFTTHKGRAIQYRNLIRDFHNMLKEAGLPRIRFHDMRHTAASIMLNNGVPVITVSRVLGHSKPSVTLDIYGHLMDDGLLEAARVMEKVVTPVELQINDKQMAHEWHTKVPISWESQNTTLYTGVK